MRIYLFCVSVLMVFLACSKPEIDSKPYKITAEDTSETHFIKDL
jgi:hypothetical protein